jgi:RNA polymerase sigma factor (sigma-70 family)
VIDQALVRAAKKGNNEKMLQLLREIEKPIYRTAFYLLGNEHDALDASQETLIKIYTKINEYRETAKFETWTYRIVTNICIDRLRKRSKISTMQIDDEAFQIEDTHGQLDFERFGMSEDIYQALEQLPELHKSVTILRYVHDFSYSEIAETLQLPLNTVKSYLFRARQHLQELLVDYSKGGVS